MLFNKNGKGSQELYEITGTFAAATQFASVANDVLDAERAVKELIGEEIYNEVATIYQKDAPSADEKALLDAVRRPIACRAVQLHALLSGVSHGEGGRKIKVDENEKIPFEWMIDRDDRAMRERYFRAVDGMFALLASKSDLWNKVPMSEMMSSCIVQSVNQFETVFPIDGSQYTFFKILPLMMDAQSHLLARTGKSTTDLQKDRRAVTYVVLSALAVAMSRWSLSVFPNVVARQFIHTYQGDLASQTATNLEIQATIRNFTATADRELLRIIADANPNTGATLLPHNDPREKFFTV